jgi:aquaporin Z
MNNRALVAEAFGTFMLNSAVLGSAFYSFGAPSGAAGILGVAFSIGITVMVTAFAIGHVSGGHYNPAVTLGLVAGGRFELGKARYYILAQVIGACAACGIFSLVGHPSATFAANGYGELSMLKASLFEVFILETVLTAFFLVVMA